MPVYAQDQAAQETERQQRIQELRQLQREERAERRQVIQAQLDTQTEEQKAALQERRQMQRRARNERMARGPQRRSNRCHCAESGADATDSLWVSRSHPTQKLQNFLRPVLTGVSQGLRP